MPLVFNVTAALAVLVAALWSTTVAPSGSGEAPTRPSVALWDRAESATVAALDTLTLDAKVGQLLAVRADLQSDVGRLARAGRIGRVVIEEGDLDRHLRALRAWQSEAVPVLVATEGTEELSLGLSDTPSFPAPLAFGAADRADLTYMAGKALAEAAQTVGVQAPGLPLGTGVSAFGDGSEDRSALAVSLTRGLRDGGVLPAARVSQAELADGRAGDFDALVDAGLMEVRLDPEPRTTRAGLAQTVRSLRQDHAFNGLLVVDVEGRDSLALPAIAAGADQVLTTRPVPIGRTLTAEVRAGRVTRADLDRTVDRILRAKAWTGLAAAPRTRRTDEGGAVAVRVSPWRPLSDAFSNRAALLTSEIARRAATVVQDPAGPVPAVGPGAPRRVVVIDLDPSPIGQGLSPFVETLASTLPLTSDHRLSLGDDGAAYGAALRASQTADLVVLSMRGDLPARHREVARALLRGRAPVVAVALGSPRVLVGLPEPASLVASYDDAPSSQRAAAEAIAGQIRIEGQLPVSVAGLYASGAGLRVRQQMLRPGTAEEAGLSAATVDRIDRVVSSAVRQGAFPGAAVAVGRDGVLVRMRGYGRLTRGGAAPTPQTPYDLASLTKVVGTTAAVMRLVEMGEIDLDARVSSYLSSFRPQGGARVTVRQLLEHSAGQRPFYPFFARDILTREAALRFIYSDTLRYRPGSRSVYSDFDMIVLGEVIESVTGEPLDEHLRDTVFAPLGMDDTGFRRPGTVDRAAAPTERDRSWRGRTLQGEVHDEAASVMGGVAGHAGLFSTAEDMARFGFLLTNGGEANRTRLFRRTTLDAFTERAPVRGRYPMGLGWMLRPTDDGYSSAGTRFGSRSFGHTGFTGTSIWVDPDQDLFVVLLTNRVHPTRRTRGIKEARADLADAVAGAIAAPPGDAAVAWGFGPVPNDLPTVAVR